MSPLGTRVAPAAALVAAVLLIGGCDGGDDTPPAGGRVKVVASIFPLADVARAVGGDHVEVSTLLPPGQTAHGFEPSPRQVERVAEARLVLTVGLGMDLWAENAARRVAQPDLTILEFHAAVSDAMDDGDAHKQEHEHEPEAEAEGEAGEHHHHEAGDPHLWLDPVRMKVYVQALAEELAVMDSANAADYRTRGDAYRAELDRLDADYRRVLGTAKIKAFISYHSAFTYTAARYGLTQEAVFHADRGGIGPKHLEKVIDFVSEHRIKVIFAEPQFPVDRLKPLVDQTGVTVRTLDPLGDPNVPGRDSYLALMRTNLATLAEALECAEAP